MRNWFRRDEGQDLGPDAAIAEALEALDPASHDPGYWFRFHRSVMAAAGPELARRRVMADITVVDVLASWSRTVVPTALLAAALAALMLVRAGAGAIQAPGGVEELLLTDVPAEAVPAILSAENQVLFASFVPDVF